MERLQIRRLHCEEIECVVGEGGNLGEGSFGVVKLGFHEIFGAVAVKCIHYKGSNIKKQKLVSKFVQDITNCQKSQHKNVIQVYAVTTWQDSIAIVMEHFPADNLKELIADKDVAIGGFLRFRFCVEIASGLAYLHNLKPMRVIHGDLKADNVMLTEALHCKIKNFGSSVVLSYSGKENTPEHEHQQSEYASIYVAPELLSSPAAKKTTAVDTYSLGIIIYIVLKRESPVPTKNLFLEKIKSGKRPELSFMNDLSQQFTDQEEFAVLNNLKTVMQQCWSHNPLDRPSMADVHHRLLQIQVNVNLSEVARQVATALEGMDIINSVQSNYQCAPLNKFCPPNFQFFQPESSNLLSRSHRRSYFESESKTTSKRKVFSNVKVTSSQSFEQAEKQLTTKPKSFKMPTTNPTVVNQRNSSPTDIKKRKSLTTFSAATAKEPFEDKTSERPSIRTNDGETSAAASSETEVFSLPSTNPATQSSEAPSSQSPAESISRTSPRTVADEINIDFPSSSLFVRPVMPLDDYSKSTSVDVSQQSTSDQEPFSIKLDNLSKSGTETPATSQVSRRSVSKPPHHANPRQPDDRISDDLPPRSLPGPQKIRAPSSDFAESNSEEFSQNVDDRVETFRGTPATHQKPPEAKFSEPVSFNTTRACDRAADLEESSSSTSTKQTKTTEKKKISKNKQRSTQTLSDGFIAINDKLKVFHVDVNACEFTPFLLPELKQRQFVHGFGSVLTLGDDIYVMGGGIKNNEVAKLDLRKREKWENIRSTVQGRDVAAVHKGCIYTCGSHSSRKHALACGERYDAGDDQWYPIEIMNYKRKEHTLVSHGEYLYVMDEKSHKNERYDPNLHKWFNIPKMTKVQSHFQAVSCGNSIYIFGKDVKTEDSSRRYRHYVERYDPREKYLDVTTTTLESRSHYGACAVNGQIYIAGGSERDNSNIVEIFEPRNNKVRNVKMDECVRFVHSMAALDVTEQH